MLPAGTPIDVLATDLADAPAATATPTDGISQSDRHALNALLAQLTNLNTQDAEGFAWREGYCIDEPSRPEDIAYWKNRMDNDQPPTDEDGRWIRLPDDTEQWVLPGWQAYQDWLHEGDDFDYDSDASDPYDDVRQDCWINT